MGGLSKWHLSSTLLQRPSSRRVPEPIWGSGGRGFKSRPPDVRVPAQGGEQERRRVSGKRLSGFLLGRAVQKWFDKICNYQIAKMTNGPTESINNLIKRVTRVGFGFRNFENYLIRALLYAGKPNWRVLSSIVVR